MVKTWKVKKSFSAVTVQLVERYLFKGKRELLFNYAYSSLQQGLDCFLHLYHNLCCLKYKRKVLPLRVMLHKDAFCSSFFFFWLELYFVQPKRIHHPMEFLIKCHMILYCSSSMQYSAKKLYCAPSKPTSISV